MSIVQRLHLPVATRSVDKKNLTVDIVASTPSVDSYGTIIDPKGWDTEQFKRNPVITWAHDDRGFTGSDGLPIANAIPDTVRVENGQLKMRLRFTPEDVNPFGYKVFRMIAEGFIHGVSVGFDPDMDNIDTMTDGDGKQVQIYRSAKLLETAVVTIPSNDDALIQRARQLNREDEMERFKRMATDVEEAAKEAQPEAKTEEPPVAPEPPVETKVEEPVQAPEDKPVELTMTATVEPALPEALHDMAQKMTAEYVQKCISYFEKKQPVNKAATRVLKRFYQIRGEAAPSEEMDAWGKMAEHMDGMQAKMDDCFGKMREMQTKLDQMQAHAQTATVEESHSNVEDVEDAGGHDNVEDARAHQNVEDPSDKGNVESPDYHNDEEDKEGEEKKQEKSAAPATPSTVQASEEAPQTARKASVQLPLSVLLLLRSKQKAAVRDAAAEALRQGVPLDKLAGMFNALN